MLNATVERLLLRGGSPHRVLLAGVVGCAPIGSVPSGRQSAIRAQKWLIPDFHEGIGDRQDQRARRHGLTTRRRSSWEAAIGGRSTGVPLPSRKRRGGAGGRSKRMPSGGHGGTGGPVVIVIGRYDSPFRAPGRRVAPPAWVSRSTRRHCRCSPTPPRYGPAIRWAGCQRSVLDNGESLIELGHHPGLAREEAGPARAQRPQVRNWRPWSRH